MRRLPDWPQRLATYVDAHRATPFVWGSHDCARFAAGAVQAITGLALCLPVWGGARAAARLLRASGGLSSALGGLFAEHPAISQARRGDLLAVAVRHGPLVAVCLGHVWCAPGTGGLVFGDLDQARGAWKVG